MWSNKQFFNDSIKVQKSCDGKFINHNSSSGTGSTGTQTIYWNNISALSKKCIMHNFRVSFDIEVNGTASANTNVYYFIKNIMHACSIRVQLSGTLSQDVPGWQAMPIFECFSEKFKSESNYLVNDIWDYKPITNCALNTTGRGVKASGGGAIKFTAHTNTFIPHELLINGCAGTGLNITMVFDNNLYSILSSPTPGTTASITHANIVYDEYMGGSTEYSISIPHFEFYNKNASYAANSTINVSSDTRSVNGIPAYAFVHLGQMGSGMSASTTNLLQKPLPIEEVKANINNNVNAWNTTSIYDMYGRCKSVGYQGSLTDFTSNKPSENAFGTVLKFDMHSVSGIDISSSQLFRINTDIKYITDSKAYGNTIYISTVYVYPAILKLSEQGADVIYFSNDIMGELEDYEPYDDLIVGAGFWDKIKSFGKKVLNNAPGLIDKASRIADVVAPNSGVSKGFDKASQISNILTGTSTSLF